MGNVSLAELGVVVVGYGSIGRRHERNLARLGVRRRLVVRRRHGANAAFTPPPDTITVDDLAAAIELRPQAAIVCLPTSLHVPCASTLLAAGIPVLIEKPLAATLGDALKLADLASGAPPGTWLSMAYCMRYHPAFAAARWALEAGKVGRPCYARAWFESYLPDWHPWEDFRESYAARPELGGGVLPTLDHELDYLNWCFGPAESAAGWLANSGALPVAVPDVASIALRYARGVTAAVTLSLCRRRPSRGFELVGNEGTLAWDLETNRLRVYGDGHDGRDETLWDGSRYDMNTMYEDMLADFLHAAAQRREGGPPLPLQTGLDTLRIVDALEQIRSTKCESGAGAGQIRFRHIA